MPKILSRLPILAIVILLFLFCSRTLAIFVATTPGLFEIITMYVVVWRKRE